MSRDWQKGSTGLPHSRRESRRAWDRLLFDLTRDVDNLRRSHVELADFGEVALSDDRIERPKDCGMVPGRVELGAVRVSRQSDEVIR